jgi:hypothetical protein
MIEFGEVPECTQNITGGCCPWHPEYEIVVFQFHTGISWIFMHKRRGCKHYLAPSGFN